jgi:hypothetical protein
MKKRKAKIADKKKRGEWVELKFMAEAAERNLPACKPFGESENFDVVVGRTGRFVAVQVKCTIFRSKNGEGYVCSVCSSHDAYRPGAFDFLVAYVVPANAWYILPAKEIEGMRAVSLMTPTSKYEGYREAWHLLHAAVGTSVEVAGGQESGAVNQAIVAEEGASQFSPFSAVGRMEKAMKEVRDRLTGGGRVRRRMGMRCKVLKVLVKRIR